jgi:hypothetical protein
MGARFLRILRRRNSIFFDEGFNEILSTAMSFEFHEVHLCAHASLFRGRYKLAIRFIVKSGLRRLVFVIQKLYSQDIVVPQIEKKLFTIRGLPESWAGFRSQIWYCTATPHLASST